MKQLTKQIPQELEALSRAVSELPDDHRSKLDDLCRQVINGTQRRQRVFNLVREALSQLRLNMKYLVFDLEATRRERDAFQQRLKQLED